MGLTAFTRDQGTRQGRINPFLWVPQDSGQWVICLGRDSFGFTDKLNAGNYVEVSQEAQWGSAILRIPARLRGPEVDGVPDGVWWRASLLIDGMEVVGKVLAPLRTRDLHDFAWCVANLIPSAVVSLRLTLMGTGGPYEVELPAFYADDLTIEPLTTRPILLNRDPEPNEVQVPADTTISIDIADPGGDGIDLSQCVVRVNGVSAYVDGAFQAGFNGPKSITQQPQADTQRIVIDPLGTFASQQVVSVRVQVATLTSVHVIDQTYHFTTERLRGPSLIGAVGRDQKTIRLTFDEAVFQGDGTAVFDGLNPDNYSIARVPGDAAVAVNVTSVTAISSSIVDLGLDIEQTPGEAYTLSVANVRDLFGNEVGV